MHPGQMASRAVLRPYDFDNGVTNNGISAPMLSMRKTNVPMMNELMSGGTISTTTVNKIPNHVSAIVVGKKRNVFDTFATENLLSYRRKSRKEGKQTSTVVRGTKLRYSMVLR